MKTTRKFITLIFILSVFLLFTMETPIIAAATPKFGFRLGTGLLWASEDKKNLSGGRLYRQHNPFFLKVLYGRSIKGLFGLNHFFSQEKEEVEVNSQGEIMQFTPKMRQYAVHIGVQASQPIAAWVRVYGGRGAAAFWRSYNPGGKDGSEWDKTRPGTLGMVGMEVRLGPKAWVGLGWRYYALG